MIVVNNITYFDSVAFTDRSAVTAHGMFLLACAYGDADNAAMLLSLHTLS
jgi:hypothetical protein